MELRTTKNDYAETNCLLEVTENATNFKAWSYGWWRFVFTDDVGNVFFNDTSYSPSTTRHQGATSGIIERLGARIGLTVYHVRDNAIGPKDLILREVSALKGIIQENIDGIKKKGSWKKTNIDRRKAIRNILFKIKDLRNIKDNYLDKKRIPVKIKSVNEIEQMKYSWGTSRWLENDFREKYSNWRKDDYFDDYVSFDDQEKKKKEEIQALKDTAKKEFFSTIRAWFTNDRNKLDISAYKDYLNSMPCLRHLEDLPKNLDKIKKLFGLKKKALLPLLRYRFIGDLEGMIPSIDSKEYSQLISTLKRLDITKENLSTFELDKMHAYLTNKINRKNYVPSEPTLFNLTEKLLSLNHADLRLIKSDRELKNEGRKQSHCIGSKQYIDKCLDGYQALNYKSYTFLITPDNQISETHGKHNATTPQHVISELEIMINQAA